MGDTFNPDWGSNPARTILELMRVKEMDARDVAVAMAMHEGGVNWSEIYDRCYLTLSFLLHGPDDPNMLFDECTAETLEAVLGGSKQFWITRYEQWRDYLTVSSN